MPEHVRLYVTRQVAAHWCEYLSLRSRYVDAHISTPVSIWMSNDVAYQPSNQHASRYLSSWVSVCVNKKCLAVLSVNASAHVSAIVSMPRGTLAKVFRSSRSKLFIGKNFAKVGYYYSFLYISCKGLPPPAARDKHAEEFRFGSASVSCLVFLDFYLSLYR